MKVPETIADVACEIVIPPNASGPGRDSGRLVDLDKDKRRFPRFSCSVDAILQYQNGLPALRRSRKWMRIMVQNISRCGMGFLHSEPMFPLEPALIVFPRGMRRVFVAMRCRRIGPNCFDIGGEFSELSDNSGEEGLR